MTNNVNKVMNLLKEIKLSFSNKVGKFAQAVLSDGSIIEWDGELEVGVACFIVSGEERIPAPEGTHQLTGDYEGISIITDPEEDADEVSEEAASEEMSKDEKTEITLSADDVENIVNGKLSTFTDKISEMFKAVTESNTELKNELISLKEDYESFKNKPSVESVESEKFARVKDANDLTTRQIWLRKRMNK